MQLLANPHRGVGLDPATEMATGDVAADPSAVRGLLAHCPAHAPTPLLDLAGLADDWDVETLAAKDERARMGLGSFKALGAAHVVARMATDPVDGAGVALDADLETLAHALRGTTLTCASAGNHGMSLAAGARVFGATAVVHVADTVPEAFIRRLEERGAQVVRSGPDYEASMAAAEAAATDGGQVLVSDSSWPGYVTIPRQVMEGYLVVAAEALDQAEVAPTHVLVQAGVGGLAAAVAAHVRRRLGETPTIVVVEPSRAPALQASIAAGRPVHADGPVSSMGRLDCKEPSHLALAALARDADAFVTVDDDEAEATVDTLADRGVATTPSGAAGLAALHHASTKDRTALGLGGTSRVLTILSEGSEAGA